MTEKIGCYAPGNYTCTCSICRLSFKGDKRAVTCKPCAQDQRIKSLETTMQDFVEFMAYFLECESTPSHEIEPHVEEMKQLLSNNPEPVKNPCVKCGGEWDPIKSTDPCPHCGNEIPF